MGLNMHLRMFPGIEQLAWFTALPYAIMLCLLIITVIQVMHLSRSGSLASAFTKLPERDAILLVFGSALIAGCFFAGKSQGYRGVHLIFVLTGLVAMRRVADDPATRTTLTRTEMIVVFLMLGGAFPPGLVA